MHAKLSARPIELGSQVYLVMRCIDEEGQPAPSPRYDLHPSRCGFGAVGSAEFAEQLGNMLYAQTVLDNLRVVGSALPVNYVPLLDGPPIKVLVQDLDIEIVAPGERLTHSTPTI